ncbi:MAG TPA: M20/M25/M40 family metallo-hydrolase [Candidatus Saccharimonadales bacterium]|nr:M20/M25/M40 family metallo-hydrolase [Candidatus Saccharimonadales bacterium]
MSTVTDLLATLVAMPTITADIPANELALDFIEQYLAARGMHCRRHTYKGRTSLTASTRKENHKNPTVLLAAHNDVVPGDESQFTLHEADGKLYGRGVYDMKFATASYLQLVDDLAQAGTLAQYDFGLMVTADEEANMDSSVEYLVGAGFRAGVVLLPDSTAPGWEMEKIAKGWWRFDLLATGKSVHGSRPWEGESASIKLIHALHELKEHFKDHGPPTDSLNIGSIHGDGVYNRVPDRMAAKVEIRLADETSSAKNKQLIDKLCAKHNVQYETFSLIEPVRPIVNVPLVDTFKDVVEQTTGKRPEGFVSLGGSDAPYFTKAGVPCILSCPMGGGHHSGEEWVSKASFLQFVPMLHTFLEQTAKHPTSSAAASVDTAGSLV